jgi:triosephosphate isomerase
VSDLNTSKPVENMEVVCAPPTLYLDQVLGSLDPRYGVAAQNAWVGGPGAFTGEVCAEQLRDVGLKWVILGHSERRALCGESNEVVGRKTAYALAAGLKVILCVGETLAEREQNITFKIITQQLGAVASVVTDWTTVVIAYEPVWAIGTGKVATTEQAQEVHAFIRGLLVKLFGDAVAQKVRILYGGSMKPANAPELLAQKDIDGGLIGGASLEARSFVELVTAAAAVK